MASRAQCQKSSRGTSSPPGTSVNGCGASSGWGYCQVRSNFVHVRGVTLQQPQLTHILTHQGELPKGALLDPWVAYLGLEDMVLLPKMVHDSKDAHGPSEAQEVGQDAESAAEDQASPEGMAECPPDGPGALWALCVLLLPRETHGQVRAAESPFTAGPSIPGNPWLLLPGETQGHICCQLINSRKKSGNQHVHRWVGPSMPTWSRWAN